MQSKHYASFKLDFVKLTVNHCVCVRLTKTRMGSKLYGDNH